MYTSKYAKITKSMKKRWSPRALDTFSQLYDMMVDNPSLFTHPAYEAVPENYHTTAWNASWMAADITDGYSV